jgi:hypothetical protein
MKPYRSRSRGGFEIGPECCCKAQFALNGLCTACGLKVPPGENRLAPSTFDPGNTDHIAFAPEKKATCGCCKEAASRFSRCRTCKRPVARCSAHDRSACCPTVLPPAI